MKLDIAKNSFIGMRSQQEDAVDYLYTDGFCRAIVCDGIGGLTDGETASELAVEVFNELVTPQSIEKVGIPELLIDAIDEMDYEVVQLRPTDGQASRPGTTMVSVVISKNFLYWASVGDSRLYIVRNGDVICATRDHTFQMTMDYLLENGFVDPAQLNDVQNRRNALTSYIGIGGVELYDLCIRPFQIQKNDLFVLATDGLYRTVDMNQLAQLLNEAYTATELSEKIMQLVQMKMTKHQDNTSYIIIRAYEAEGQT